MKPSTKRGTSTNKHRKLVNKEIIEIDVINEKEQETNTGNLQNYFYPIINTNEQFRN